MQGCIEACDIVVQSQGKAAAQDVGLTAQEVDAVLGPALPAIRCDDAELENARWFSRDWLMAVMAGVYIRTQAGSATAHLACAAT